MEESTAVESPGLSPAQERLWFIDQFVRMPATTTAWRLRLRGRVDKYPFDAALRRVVDVEPALRLAVGSASSRPVASLGNEPDLAFVDLLGMPEVERAGRAAAVSRAEATRPFPAAGPLIRLSLIRLALDEHLLTVTGHRAAIDRGGVQALVEAIGKNYEEIVRDGITPSAKLPTSAHSAAVDEAPPQAPVVAASNEDVKAQAEVLRDVQPLELPTDRSRSPHGAYAAAVARRTLAPETGAALAQLAESQDTDLPTVAYAGLQALLHRYSSQDVVALGVPVKEEPAIGPVETTVVVVTRASATTTTAELVAQLKATLAGPAVPLEQLITAVNPPRDPSRSPLFQVNAAATGDWRPRLGGLQVTTVDVETSGATLFDLDFWFDIDSTGGGSIAAVYRTDLFDAATVDRMLGHLERLLAAGAAAPDEPVSRLVMIGDEERRLVVEGFNQTDVPYPSNATVHELFEEQVLRTPDRRAITFEGAHLTYKQLSEESNRIAHYLRAQGVGRGTLVGMALERSLDLMPVAIGIIKAGGAWVPLDPAYPTDRLAFMMEDTAATLLISQEKLLDILPETDARLLVLERIRDEIAAQSADDLPNVNTADDLTYIVYTSGSTGRPKGVRQPHRGIARLGINTDILILDQETSYLQISPLSFDASTLEIFGPLFNGGRVVLMPPGVPTPARVAQTVREQGVNTLWLVAPLANLTIDAHIDDLRGLRQFMAGGDVLSIPHMRKVREKLPHVALVNGYGPTEVTSFSVSHKILDIDPDWPSIPIGRPMHNTTAYILDDYMQPLPVGVWGELYLGGPGVAEGYHNRPDLNAERFLPDPFRPAPGAQLYRTGDRVRWLPDGLIQFHGRFDTQVKIDGLRVELGEIQSVIAADDAVSAAVVTAPEVAGRRMLIAYVIPADREKFDATELRARLATLLPSVMVPAHYITLDRMPLTPNNKVDLRALPVPETASMTTYRPPQTHTQQTLAEIWQDILGIPQVGLDDNFFQLGGHSLRAVPLIAAISSQFGIDLGVQDVFEAPILSDLAVRVEEHMVRAISPEDMAALLAEIG